MVSLKSFAVIQKATSSAAFYFYLTSTLFYPLHRLNHILALAEAGAGGADGFAFDTLIVEERRFKRCARRNSIRKHPKSQ